MKLLNKYLRRRYRCYRVVFLVASIACGLTITYFKSSFSGGRQRIRPDYIKTLDASNRRLLANNNDTTAESESESESESYIPGWNGSADASYPKELFHIDQLRQGAVILHCIGLIYMFIALAIVCDEFFVPALEVIIEVLNISEDVAGATFMAAGGSAPELFTSLVGVFISKSDVGIGTIVGSAVFNILFVIGMCSFFSKGVLTLTWWPLFRDVNFYLLSLILLIYFFLDEEIKHYEAIILFGCYVLYVLFMKFNVVIEQKFKMFLHKRCGGKKPETSDQSLDNTISRKRSDVSQAYLRNARKSIVVLLAHANENVLEPGVKGQTSKEIHKVNSNQGPPPPVKAQTPQPKGKLASPVASGSGVVKSNTSVRKDSNEGSVSTVRSKPQEVSTSKTNITKATSISLYMSAVGLIAGKPDSEKEESYKSSEKHEVSFKDVDDEPEEPSEPEGLEEEEQEPMDMSWPDGTLNRINYIMLFPICFLLWASVPDVRNEAKRKFFPITFILSILWIGGYSYLMVWWATTIGATVNIDTTIMGLTFLAAGTSIPDLITSVIVAKKGFGDMAVSSSIGSNIFDITVGLPVPWMLYIAIFGQSYKVSAQGIACSVILLMLMLVAVVLSIALSGWKMQKILGVAMMFLYIVFLTIAILISFGKLECPDIRMT